MPNPYLSAIGITEWVERDYIDPFKLDPDPVPNPVPHPVFDPARVQTIHAKQILEPLAKTSDIKPAHRPITYKTNQSVLAPHTEIQHMMQSEQQALDKWSMLEQMVSHCQGCERAHKRIHPIFGTGASFSHLSHVTCLLFVLPSPSREEDLSGDMLSHSSKILFSHLLEALQINKKSIFLSHAIKCKSHSETMPSTSTCKAYLNAQISLLSPQTIVLMDVTLEGLDIPSSSQVIQTVSPEMISANPLLKKTLWQDLKRLKQNTIPSDTPYISLT